MDVGGPAWEEGRRAWRRLVRHVSSLDGAAGDQAHTSLDALADIASVRRLLEQAELASVKAARRHRRSWAEIATNLGVSRQSAWERWRELDESVPSPAASTSSAGALDATVRGLVRKVRRSQPAHVLVVVPDVLAMSCDDARQILQDAGLVALGHNPGGAPLPLPTSSTGTIVDQVPSAGAVRRAGSSVTVWVERGGGSAGVREPRRPVPSPESLSADPTAQPRSVAS